MLSRSRFTVAYELLAASTGEFGSVDIDDLTAALEQDPAVLAPLRMIAGLTLKELAVAARLVSDVRLTEASLRELERQSVGAAAGSARLALRASRLRAVAEAFVAVLERRILTVPEAASEAFHSKLDKPDTIEGWISVAQHARDGVPYSELLYQRYVGGVWRQVQDAYSEVKGDAILELPLETLLREERIPHWRSKRGATGARETAQRYGIDPGPDFLIPAESPAVIVETKVVEDGGSARDKAARIQRFSEIAAQRGLVICAVVDGKGWSERPQALADVVIATQGRTFSLSTLPSLIAVPEVETWRNRDVG